MRRFLLFAAVLAALGAGVWAAFHYGRRDLQVPDLPDGDQEIAWIHAATSGPAWERFVAGIHRVKHDWPQIRIDDRRVIPRPVDRDSGSRDRRRGHVQSPAYPLVQTHQRNRHRLLGEAAGPAETCPLAFIGGGTSDRAVELARALATQSGWPGPPPLLLITTATANTIYLDPAAEHEPSATGSTPLMDVYRGRSFRFCFTNRQMAQAVVDFVWSQPDLRPIGNPTPAFAAIAETALNPWGAVGLLAAYASASTPHASALEWDDDPYSIDLSKQFHEAFHQPHLPRMLVKNTRSIPYSVGGYYRPNAWEAQATEYLIEGLREAGTGAAAARAAARRRRRPGAVLRAVAAVLPLAGRSLVAVTGDSMNFNARLPR